MKIILSVFIIVMNYQFNSSFKGFILNPNYIIRSRLFKAISVNKKYIHGKVLDFGCGEKPYKELFAFDQYVGVDFQSSGHNNVNNNIDIYYNGASLPTDDSFFDSFIATEVFEHVFNIDELLSEIHRTLKKGSTGLITIPFFVGEHEEPYDFARYTSFGFSSLLKKHGFSVVKHQKIGNTYDVLLYVIRISVSNFVYRYNNQYIRLFLNVFLGFPIQIIISFLSCFSFTTSNPKIYLNNLFIIKKI